MQKSDKNLQSKFTVKSRSRLDVEGRVDLTSERCTYDPSFMALAQTVSEIKT